MIPNIMALFASLAFALSLAMCMQYAYGCEFACNSVCANVCLPISGRFMCHAKLFSGPITYKEQQGKS